ncbi:ribosome maturation factor RimP [Gilvimarinus agarilyticus]|uniref:ribosome maturation factor RimP n=1 Tax=unclassified Gilvimarinus TaxID=2642066 RepID=UPI001C0A5159|nr:MULTISPECIES: ribosome maturation factor RimP [unclassified Gilvimarinus]MBU2885342.1 ribosome maturation factor RimP [Gilvimarinus agarilyticus]MDO6570241.1 ribosome maturation factor RimP [Gilvimarinus sp. 2_MG-2023]MDO6748236.1 ribosome maturation factor RimP [Gilvimarinus sp. 1_MG-2023]
MASKEQQLVDLFTPTVTALECELWGVEYMTGGPKKILRVYIDAEKGVMLEDCEKVSRQLSALMDVEDPIAGEYTLEVSSPGMDRPLYTLEQFKQFVGSVAAVKLRIAFEGRRKFKGVISAVEENDVVLVVDNEEYLLPIESIDKANIVPQF